MTYQKTNPEIFFRIKKQMPANLTVFLSDYSATDYKSMHAVCYLSDDAKSGYAIKPNGDLISVCSLPEAKQGAAAIRSAIAHGAQKLDCIGNFLVTLYGKFGFIEYKRESWNDTYAPANWDYDRLGRPDIVYMKLP